MKKIILYLLLTVFSTYVYSEQLFTYNNSYKGVYVGKSTLADAIKVFGFPKSKKINSNNVRYFFDKFDLTIQDATGKVNTIIIFDRNYTDSNGVKVGTSKSTVKSNIGGKVAGNAIADLKNGIVYWFEDDEVREIVLTHEMVDR